MTRQTFIYATVYMDIRTVNATVKGTKGRTKIWNIENVKNVASTSLTSREKYAITAWAGIDNADIPTSSRLC